jgi:hypothetical protein
MNDKTNTMNMVSERKKINNGLSNLTFEHLDLVAARSASLLYRRWVTFFDQMDENESFLLGRLRSIHSFAENVSDDAYLRNLFFIFIGSRSKGESLQVCLIKMEKLRLHFIEENKYREERNKKPAVNEKMILSPGDEQKLKYLMRFSVCVRLAQMIYQRLFTKSAGRYNWMREDFHFDSFPLVFENQLEQFLLKYQNSSN